MKARIIKRTCPGARETFVIQQKHFLFRWWWVDAWVNSPDPGATSSFGSLKEAQDNLWEYDGSKCKEEIVPG